MVKTIIFSKAPQAGFAKTRMIPALGAEGAAALSRRLLDSTLATVLTAQLGLVELYVTPEKNHPAWHSVRFPKDVVIHTQSEGNLGKRLLQATQASMANGNPTLLIGIDCVEITVPLLREAAAKLQQVDTVLHATADGGYALLGLRRFHPLLFTDIAWGTNTVAGETVRRIEQLGWSLFQGRTLHDLDEPQDLYRLSNNSFNFRTAEAAAT